MQNARWNIHYNPELSFMRLTRVAREPGRASLDLLVFPGGGVTHTRSVWCMRDGRTPLFWQDAGQA